MYVQFMCVPDRQKNGLRACNDACVCEHMQGMKILCATLLLIAVMRLCPIYEARC